MTTTQSGVTGEHPRVIKIDLDQAVRLKVPEHMVRLEPVKFSLPGAQGGWIVRTPSEHPLATPAYEDGRLFVGGGYGSYVFYALNAQTGEVIWQIGTADDGPTAAVVEHGYVVFNTESCSVIVCEAATGHVVWQEWLGDPLMSQPAIAGDYVLIAYPAGQGKPAFRPGMTVSEQQQAIAEAEQHRRPSRAHHLLCAELRTGRHVWEQEITGDVISAPIVEGDQVFLTCFDGTSFCLKVADGSIVWHKANQGTSAPLVVGEKVFMTEREMLHRLTHERVRSSSRHSGADDPVGTMYRRESKYRSVQKGGGSNLKGAMAASLDAGVGFGAAPQAAKLDAAAAHLGIGTVAGAWAYQGSRAAFAKGRLYNNLGRHLCCLRDDAPGPVWEAEFTGSRVDLDDQMFSPPALGRDYAYFTSTFGHALWLRQDTGELGRMYATDRPIVFQPCLAKGRVYFGTVGGDLICIDTGSDDADGWYMWGGNAQHNKAEPPAATPTPGTDDKPGRPGGVERGGGHAASEASRRGSGAPAVGQPESAASVVT